MDKETLIKALVAGVALYVIYQWLSSPSVPVTPVSGGQIPQPVGAGQSSGQQTGQSQSGGANPPTVVLYTPDEWNYYREQEGKPIRDALQYPGVTPENRGTFRITKEQYEAWVGGLSGLNWGALGAMGAWKN